MRYRIACLCLLLVIGLSAIAQQQTVVPRLIRFAGQVTDASGTVGITFTLHKSQQDNTVLWTETQNVKVDASGKYSILLGVTKPDGIPTDLFTSGEAQWLGVRVEGKTEQPRVLLVSVPYALKAAEAETLAGHAATEFVTSDKLNSAVQQQVQQAHFNTANSKSNAVNGVLSSTATNFVDSTTNQVVGVTQNGTGKAIVATAKSNTAISGTTNATTGSAIGVYGSSASSGGVGIFGAATAKTGNATALFGSAAGSEAIAIAANASSTTGKTIGLEATVFSLTGVAGIFQNAAGGPLLYLYNGVGTSRVLMVSIDGQGNINTVGGINANQGYFSALPAFDAISARGGDQSGFYAGTAISARGGDDTGASGTAGDGLDATGGYVSYNSDVPGIGVHGVGGQPASGSYTGVIGGAGGVFDGGEGDLGGGAGVSGLGGNVYTGSLQAAPGGYFIGGNSASGNGGYGLYAKPGFNQNIAGWFQGDIVVTGTVSAGTKDFKIDHPQDPANKYLVHASVESSEMMNIYSGNVRLNESGEAVVKMPSWFESLNGDFRYSLTSIGAPGPNLYIKQELANGQFVVGGGAPGQKVSWTVTAVRHDAYATAHPLVVEEEKKGVEQGRYLHPDAFGKTLAEGVGAAVAPKMNPVRKPAVVEKHARLAGAAQ